MNILVGDRLSIERAKGKFKEAETYWRRALEGFERTIRRDHPHTLVSVNNLGQLLKDQGKFVLAEPFVRRALEEFERTLGPDHHDTLGSANNLGLLLNDLGMLDLVEPFLRRALEGFERTLGRDHPHTARVSARSLRLLLEALERAK